MSSLSLLTFLYLYLIVLLHSIQVCSPNIKMYDLYKYIKREYIKSPDTVVVIGGGERKLLLSGVFQRLTSFSAFIKKQLLCSELSTE